MGGGQRDTVVYDIGVILTITWTHQTKAVLEWEMNNMYFHIHNSQQI